MYTILEQAMNKAQLKMLQGIHAKKTQAWLAEKPQGYRHALLKDVREGDHFHELDATSHTRHSMTPKVAKSRAMDTHQNHVRIEHHRGVTIDHKDNPVHILDK